MLSTPLLHKIAKFLDWEDLANFSQVNKKTRAVCSDQRIWKRETLRIFTTISVKLFFQNTQTDWKDLFTRNGPMSTDLWRSLPVQILPLDTSIFLLNEIRSSLKDPEPVMPRLRREFCCFPTVIQDLFANPEDQFLVSDGLENPIYEIAGILRDNWELLDAEFTENSEVATLQSFVSYQCMPETPCKSFLLRIYQSLQFLVENYCKILCIYLQELQDEELIEEYLNKWESFSFTIVHINSLFSPFTECVNKLYGSFERTLSVIKLMSNIWKCHVFNRLEERLIGTCVDLCANKSDPEILRGFTEALCDLSLDEDTVYFKNHSRVKLSGPIASLHNRMLESVNLEFKKARIPDAVSFVFENLAYLESFSLPATFQAMKIKQLSMVKDMIEKAFLDEFHQFTPETDEIQNRNYIGSSLGRFLFEETGNPRKVIQFMHCKTMNPSGDLVKAYNSLTDYYTRNEDRTVERIAEIIGFDTKCVVAAPLEAM